MMSGERIEKITNQNNCILAWKAIILLLSTDIVLLSVNYFYGNQIIKLNVFSLVYFHIPVLITILYALTTEKYLYGSFIFKIEIRRWDRYIWILSLTGGFFLLLISISSDVKASAFFVVAENIKAISNNLSFSYYLKTIIVAPVTEEILFRGIILGGFLTRFSPVKSILFSTLIFSFFHLNIFQFVATLPVGLLLGWYYYKTRNLLSCIIIHSINNIFAVLTVEFLIGKLHQINTLDSSLLKLDNQWFFILMSGSLIINGLYYLLRSFRDDLKVQSVIE